jgi:hypothetical protein
MAAMIFTNAEDANTQAKVTPNLKMYFLANF